MNASSLITAVCVAAIIVSGCTSSGKPKKNSKKAAEYQAKLGAGYLQRNRLGLAKEYLEKALKSNSNSAQAQHYYALLQERLGDDAKASHYFRKAMAQDGKNPELLNNYGSFLCKSGKIQQAVSAFMGAASDPLYKTPDFAYSNAGICLKSKGNFTQAESYLRKSLSLQPNSPTALFHMADLSYNQSENAKAQAFLYRYNERHPDTPETLLLCYKTNHALHEGQPAEACANRLLSKFPQSKEAAELN
uniref:Type IV pilus biogenesis/stability protein PilW n=1 Tax=uncultured Thiotrichaceae bacterium TaxID=298394 RepID=A0A6S6TZT3_9GAMM|nr:MAG: Type IV pilus biogenesis/stability protein PilW [uncultured Thiotrichaceae bacterium]